MPKVCFPTQSYELRDRIPNDPFEALTPTSQGIINNAANFFEGMVNTDTTPVPSEGERLALRRAMARFLIDSSIASYRDWII